MSVPDLRVSQSMQRALRPTCSSVHFIYTVLVRFTSVTPPVAAEQQMNRMSDRKVTLYYK